jgi:hypothetical protein
MSILLMLMILFMILSMCSFYAYSYLAEHEHKTYTIREFVKYVNCYNYRMFIASENSTTWC